VEIPYSSIRLVRGAGFTYNPHNAFDEITGKRAHGAQATSLAAVAVTDGDRALGGSPSGDRWASAGSGGVVFRRWPRHCILARAQCM